MKTLVTFLLIAVVALSAVGCTPNILLKNPQTGETVVCKGGSGYGLAGIPGRNLQYRCLDDFEKQGYQRVADSK
jgi:hypothetical protein